MGDRRNAGSKTRKHSKITRPRWIVLLCICRFDLACTAANITSAAAGSVAFFTVSNHAAHGVPSLVVGNAMLVVAISAMQICLVNAPARAARPHMIAYNCDHGATHLWRDVGEASGDFQFGHQLRRFNLNSGPARVRSYIWIHRRFRGHNGHGRTCRRFGAVVNDPSLPLTAKFAVVHSEVLIKRHCKGRELASPRANHDCADLNPSKFLNCRLGFGISRRERDFTSTLNRLPFPNFSGSTARVSSFVRSHPH